MLATQFTPSKLLEILKSNQSWETFPQANNRSQWESFLKDPLKQFRHKDLLARAKLHLNHPWPSLPATLFMEFVQNGNRGNFEALYFKRRIQFSELVMAECLEYKGQFINDIINGFYVILEETSWCLPAHHGRQEGDPLPDTKENLADLFACQTAMILGEAYYLLKDKLFEISPNLCYQIKNTIKTRVLNVFATTHKTSYWEDGHNNWAIWCASNVLGSAIYTVDDPEDLATLIHKLLKVFDAYYDKYSNDGGCDEGPNYWGVSPGIMTVFLELLYSRTSGSINVYDNPKIKRMANFIVDAHISKENYINFADAGIKASPPRGLAFRLGQRTQNANMQNLVLLHSLKWDQTKSLSEIPLVSDIFTTIVRDYFWFEPKSKDIVYQKNLVTWYPHTELLFCRDNIDPDKGLFFIIKAGHNGENHNHNDVGHFIIYSNGRPAIIDVGVETYCKDTFNAKRYTLPYMRSSSHNIAVINGTEQINGKQYKANSVKHESNENVSTIEMNIEGCFPKESHLVSYKRTAEYQHKNSVVIITDSIEFDQTENTLEINFFTQEKPTLNNNQFTLLSSPELKLKISEANMKFEITEMAMTDGALLRSWRSPLWKISGKLKVANKKITIQYEFVQN